MENIKTITLTKGTLVYHKTMCNFKPKEINSYFYTLIPPPNNTSDRGFRVLIFELKRDIVVLKDCIHSINKTPLKYLIINLDKPTFPNTYIQKLFDYLAENNCDAILSKMDFGSQDDSNFEFICHPSILNFVQEYIIVSSFDQFKWIPSSS